MKTALHAAEQFVAEQSQLCGVELILRVEKTLEFSSGWVFYYDSKKHLESDSIADALAGNAPIIVSKRDGSIHVTGTAHPIDYYIGVFEKK